MRVLHVDDDEASRYIVGRILGDAGFIVECALTGAEGLSLAASSQPDLIVLDVKLPDMDGFEVCRRLRAEPATASIPVLHLSAHFVRGRDRVRGLDIGADAYLAQPVEPDELVATARALIRVKVAEDALRRSRDELEEKVRLRTAEIERSYDATIDALARALELRDHETEGHSRRVVELTLRLAEALGIDEESLVHMRRGALLHDIGKIGVPDRVLLKRGPLDESEWALMRQHPMHAMAMLGSIEFLHQALEIPLCHHEKWDGSGYPRGLKAEEIPLSARIFAVVDIWDALAFDRPYRKAWPKQRICLHLEKLAGTHLDPALVSTFLSLMRREDRGIATASSEPVPEGEVEPFSDHEFDQLTLAMDSSEADVSWEFPVAVGTSST